MNSDSTADERPPGPKPSRYSPRQNGRIVVGVDGSESSIDAMRWATGQSALTGAYVEAVTSWEYPQQGMMEFGTLDVDWAANAQQSLDIALHQAFGDDDVHVRTVVVHGRPAHVLISAAEGADLLVVGSRGHGAVAGMLLGSVSEDLVAHAPCPVVVIRHHGVPASSIANHEGPSPSPLAGLVAPTTAACDDLRAPTADRPTHRSAAAGARDDRPPVTALFDDVEA